MKRLIVFLLFPSLYSASNASDFDNWYFDFSEGETMSLSLKYLPESEVHQWVILSERIGKKLEGDNHFLTKANFRYMGFEKSVEFSILWTHVEGAEYTGVYSDSEGLTGTYFLTLKNENKVELLGEFSSKIKVSSEGELTSEGTIYSTDKLIKPDGTVLLTGKSTAQKKVP